MRLIEIMIALAIVGILFAVFAVFAPMCYPEETRYEPLNYTFDPTNYGIVARQIEGGSLSRWYDIDNDGDADIKVTYRFAKRNGKYIFLEISREKSTLKPLVNEKD